MEKRTVFVGRRTISVNVIIIFASLFFVSTTQAWNPIKDIGNAVGSVFRGVGSVFGQGLAGFAQPTITEAANSFQRIADTTLAKAEASGERLIDKLVKDADAAATQRITQVSAAMTTHIDDVDKRVRENIAEVDEMLSLKLGSADIIATRQINSVEIALTSVVRYASSIVLITAILAVLFYIVASRWKPNASIHTLGPGVVYGLGLLAVFSAIAAGASWVLQPSSADRMDEIEKQLIAAYSDSIQTEDFDSAVFFASQYRSLEAAKLAPRFLVQFADLQRDIRKRSALFTSESGSRELFARVAQIGKTWDAVSGDLDHNLSFLKYEVPATSAMIAWQNSLTISEQMKAGCIAAAALSEFDAQTKGVDNRLNLASGYIWLSASYLNWLVQTDPSWKGGGLAAICSNEIPAGTLPEDWMTAAIGLGDELVKNPALAPPGIEAVFQYNVLSAEFYRDVLPRYADAVIGDTQYRAYADQAQVDVAKVSRDAALLLISERWAEYTQKIKAIPGLTKKDIVLSMSGLPLGIVARAKLMTGNDRPAPTPEIPLPGAPERIALTDLAVCKASFADVEGLFEPTVFETLCLNQQTVDTSLRNFEQRLQVAFQPDNNIEVRLKGMADDFRKDGGDMLALTTNLLACISYIDTGSKRWEPCSKEQPRNPVRFVDWLAQNTSKDVASSQPEGATRIAMAR